MKMESMDYICKGVIKYGKGLYPFGIREDDAIEKYEEIRIYYEEGRYKRGSFVDKFIAHIHHI